MPNHSYSVSTSGRFPQDGNVSFEEFLNIALEYGQISSRAESACAAGRVQTLSVLLEAWYHHRLICFGLCQRIPEEVRGPKEAKGKSYHHNKINKNLEISFL